ncbi:uncharacterized protein ARMOST_15432 [Armillaria ostoyae]|uniref:Uncharacterized protein n=1 Tax=Armillaria ostoyae TaxID=47428 RepID=A0A284RTJ4_ARMOS|nr:uncharacterized protein ARMOST_15432 [Armillaria ostoyae]
MRFFLHYMCHCTSSHFQTVTVSAYRTSMIFYLRPSYYQVPRITSFARTVYQAMLFSLLCDPSVVPIFDGCS